MKTSSPVESTQNLEQLVDKWLICADPDSQEIYTLNINTNEVHQEKDVDPHYRRKAQEAIKSIENLLKIKSGNWLAARKEIDLYRRRKIPAYLLHKQSSSIPTYLCQSTLSLAFANVNSIKLHVKLNRYEELFENMPQEAQALDHPNILEIEAGLVTGADEVIKNVLREVYLRFQKKLKPRSDKNQFILQIAGLKEYLTGNHPMLSYDRVRISLRGMKHLEVTLTEVPKYDEQSQLFLPIITRPRRKEEKKDEKKEEKKEYFPPIDWNIYKDVPVLLWYPPYQLIPSDEVRKTVIGSRLSFQMQFKDPYKSQAISTPLKNTDIGVHESNDKLILQFSGEHPTSTFNRLRTSTRDRVNDLVTMKNELSRRQMLRSEQNVLYSGECDWPFTVRICAIENLLQVLESDTTTLEQKNRATFNGMVPPLYITKKNAKAEGEKLEEEKPPLQQMHYLKLFKKVARESDEEPKPTEYKHFAYGGYDRSGDIQAMQKKYGLDFVPYLISVEASIYHGCRLLTNWSQAETRKVPFSVAPRFYETLRFPGIKVSMLPQETRLCFNIIIHSAQGQTQVLGSTSVYIFDEHKRFRSAINALNIWPFYKADPRLLCQGQYWGLNNPNEPRPSNFVELRKFIQLKYGRLFVQLEQFTQPMVWSLRDEKQMEELGFSKSAKGFLYFQMKNLSQPNHDTQQQKINQKENPNEQVQAGPPTNETQHQMSSGSIITGLRKKAQYQPMQSNSYNSSLFRPQQMQSSPGGAYDQYIYGGDQNQTQLRFDGRDERTFHQFATSFMHMPQGSSMYLHGMPQQPSVTLSSYRISTQQSHPSNYSASSLTPADFMTSAYPYKNWSTTPRTEDLAILQTLLKVNPLNRPYYTNQHKFILMICRNHYKTLPYALQIFLMAIDWDDPEQVREAHNMIKLWIPLPPEDALPLLDAQFADETVRLYAVERVSILSDDELALYMLELTQGLMFEKHLFNPLAEMLLERALQNPWVVGHELFWLLRSQLSVKPQFERYSLLLEQMLMLCGQFREDLLKEVLVNDELSLIASKVKDQDPKNATAFLQKELITLQRNIPKPFTFALDSRMEAKEFIYEKDHCKVMNSKKQPLWLTMKSNYDENQHIFPHKDASNNQPIQQEIIIVEGENKDSKENKESPLTGNIIQIIFKNGDDLRQDLLTLQLIKVMDKIWLDAGMDFRMKPYKVIATQDQVGMIEVVQNSRTTEKIHSEYGVMGAFQTKSIWNYLKKKNTEPQSFEIATDNFFRSCAGYCVATYIMGVGDRHSGNIMLTDTGHLFHIDFGHFLGNFKKKWGVNRERAKFVLTEEMAFVMGGREGDLFKKFQSDCTNAYNMVRKHGHFLINIFLMNLSAGMPELQSAHNVKYLEEMLALNISDQEAIARFNQEIITSLNDTWRTIDNFFHNIKRRENK